MWQHDDKVSSPSGPAFCLRYLAPARKYPHSRGRFHGYQRVIHEHFEDPPDIATWTWTSGA